MRGKRTPDDVRAKVVAELLTGERVPDVAARHGIAERTVWLWLQTDDRFAVVCTAKKQAEESAPDLGALVGGYLTTLLKTLTKQAEVAGTEDYIIKQPAGELAILHGTMADKGYRLLSAVAAASGGRGNPGAPREIDAADPA